MIAKIRTHGNKVYYSFVFGIDYKKNEVIVFDESFTNLKLMKIWNRDHQSYFLLIDGNTAEYRIVTDEFISFWDESSFTKIVNNNLFNEDAKKIQSKIIASKWKSLKDDYDVKALLWSVGNFHDSHIVKILERNEYTDVLFDTTWGQFVALRLYNIKTFNVDETQCYIDCDIELLQDSVRLKFIPVYEGNDDLIEAEKIEFDIFFENRIRNAKYESYSESIKHIDKTRIDRSFLQENIDAILEIKTHSFSLDVLVDDVMYVYGFDRIKWKKELELFKSFLDEIGFRYEMVDFDKMFNDEMTYSYEYPFSKEQFLSNIPDGISYYDDKYMIRKSNDMFFVGVERLGHSSGNWYVAKLEDDNGKTKICGKFVIDPDDNGNSTYERVKHNDFWNDFWIVILFIIFFPVLLIVFIGNLIYKKIAKNSYTSMTNEERLDRVMIDHFYCKKINK